METPHLKFWMMNRGTPINWKPPFDIFSITNPSAGFCTVVQRRTRLQTCVLKKPLKQTLCACTLHYADIDHDAPCLSATQSYPMSVPAPVPYLKVGSSLRQQTCLQYLQAFLRRRWTIFLLSPLYNSFGIFPWGKI